LGPEDTYQLRILSCQIKTADQVFAAGDLADPIPGRMKFVCHFAAMKELKPEKNTHETIKPVSGQNRRQYNGMGTFIEHMVVPLSPSGGIIETSCDFIPPIPKIEDVSLSPVEFWVRRKIVIKYSHSL